MSVRIAEGATLKVIHLLHRFVLFVLQLLHSSILQEVNRETVHDQTAVLTRTVTKIKKMAGRVKSVLKRAIGL